MGHSISTTARLFRSVRYHTKTTEEVRDAMTRKIATLQALTAEREARMLQLRDSYDIDAERLAILVMQYQDGADFVSYDRQGGADGGPLVPVGVVANLVREREMIDSEREQIWKIQLVLRNLRDEERYLSPRTGAVEVRACVHELDDNDLDYLGF